MNKLITAALCLTTVTPSYSQVKDIDGKSYKTLKIGNQIWMAENLNVSHYRNGDPIPQVQDSAAWSKLTTGAWCYYENKKENGDKFGKLYNWYAVNDPRGLASKGWHIPTDAEWNNLIETLGGVFSGVKMKSTSEWSEHGNGTNESGFTSLPGGYRNRFEKFDGIGINCHWWSSSEEPNDINVAWCHFLDVGRLIYRYNLVKRLGMSVRCLKD